MPLVKDEIVQGEMMGCLTIKRVVKNLWMLGELLTRRNSILMQGLIYK